MQVLAKAAVDLMMSKLDMREILVPVVTRLWLGWGMSMLSD